MIRIPWITIYGVALSLDILAYITLLAAGSGLIINRLISLTAGPIFVFIFLLNGTSGWGWKLLLGNIGEVTPVIGDFVPLWTIAIWRIHKSNKKIEPVAQGQVPVAQTFSTTEDGETADFN